MPLLLPFGQFTSTCSLKSVNFAFVTRLAPLFTFFRMPPSTVHWFVPPNVVHPSRFLPLSNGTVSPHTGAAVAAQRGCATAGEAVPLAAGRDEGALQRVAGDHAFDDRDRSPPSPTAAESRS